MISSGWVIEGQCIQCGAPVSMEETTRILSCPFCRVRHFLSSPGCFRYFLTPRQRGMDDHLFIPYLRFRGMVFSCGSFETQYKVVDTSLVTIGGQSLPPSLGLRPQALKLRFVSSEVKADFLKSVLQPADILANINNQSLAEPATERKDFSLTLGRAFIGEVVSLVYAPYFGENNALYDAIDGKIIRGCDYNCLRELIDPRANEGWKVSFLPTLCPDCGWDLKGEEDSCVLLCSNCDSAWEATGSGFQKTNYGLFPPLSKDSLYLPFWRMRTEIDSPSLKSYADLVRFANLPKVIQEKWEKSSLYFWSPGFKIQPKLFGRLLQQITIWQPAEDLETNMAGLSLFPVNLPAQEAQESIIITLTSLAQGKKHLFPGLQEVKISVKDRSLIYIPFEVRGNELIQGQINLSLSRNALWLGKKI